MKGILHFLGPHCATVLNQDWDTTTDLWRQGVEHAGPGHEGAGVGDDGARGDPATEEAGALVDGCDLYRCHLSGFRH